MEDWTNRAEKRPITWFVIGIIALLLFIWALSAATFGLRVATAGVVGKGQAHIQKEGATNRILQQAGFEQKYADIRKYDAQIVDAAKAVKDWDTVNSGKTDNAIGTLVNQRVYLVQVLTGLKQQCQTTVQNYNADARKYLAQDFRAADLPAEISLNTHCKEGN